MKLEPSTRDDLPQLSAWMNADPWHINEPEFWLTGADCFFVAKVTDSMGPVAYLRVDENDDSYRLHGQFCETGEVSRTRTAKAIVSVIKLMKSLAVSNSKKYLITQSINAPLIAFLSRLEFQPCENDDYKLRV
jgi:hypothetical protein